MEASFHVHVYCLNLSKQNLFFQAFFFKFAFDFSSVYVRKDISFCFKNAIE